MVASKTAPQTGKRTQLVSIADAAQRLGCSRGHVYNLIGTGALSAVEIKATGARSKTRVLEDELEAFIASRISRAG